MAFVSPSRTCFEITIPRGGITPQQEYESGFNGSCQYTETNPSYEKQMLPEKALIPFSTCFIGHDAPRKLLIPLSICCIGHDSLTAELLTGRKSTVIRNPTFSPCNTRTCLPMYTCCNVSSDTYYFTPMSMGFVPWRTRNMTSAQIWALHVFFSDFDCGFENSTCLGSSETRIVGSAPRISLRVDTEIKFPSKH